MLEGKPLADKMRPDTLQDYIGQSRAVGQETLLRSLLETNEIPSLFLWGPPCCGNVSVTLAEGQVRSSEFPTPPQEREPRGRGPRA